MSDRSSGRLAALAARVSGLTGWRRRGLGLGLGLVSALALPPLGLLPVLLLTLPGLVWLLDGSRDRRGAFGAGFWFGTGWFMAGLYWISIALLIEPWKTGWMVPFAVFGLSALLGAFYGGATLLVRLSGVDGPGRIPLLAGAFVLAEWLRGWVLTGFPWNPLGSVWDPLLPILQLGALAGVHGLTFLAVLAFTLPALLADPLGRRARLAVVGLAAGLPLAVFAWGAARLAGHGTELEPGVTLRLVQANIAQSHKWRDELRMAHLQDHVELSRSPGLDKVTHVVWPETAAPYFLDTDPVARAIVAEAAPPGGIVLTGAPRVTPRDVRPMQLWNSLMAVDGMGRLAGSYDKVHLVPFGEYVPGRGLLPLLKITWGAVDFSSGPGLRTIAVPGAPPASPLICYEAVFAGEVVGRDQPRPGWLLNVTNDGWFGMSSGPYQHLASARLRAIEEGLPLVRAANTGISAVFDPLGRPVARLGLGERGVLDAPLPRATAATPYAEWGDKTLVILALVTGLLSATFGRLKHL